MAQNDAWKVPNSEMRPVLLSLGQQPDFAKSKITGWCSQSYGTYELDLMNLEKRVWVPFLSGCLNSITFQAQ